MANVSTLNLDLRHLLKTHSAGYLVYTLGWSVIHIKSRHIQHSFDPVGLKKKTIKTIILMIVVLVMMIFIKNRSLYASVAEGGQGD